MTQFFLAHPLGSTFEASPFVPNTEHVTVWAVLDVMKDAVLLSLPVPTAAGLELLRETKANIGNYKWLTDWEKEELRQWCDGRCFLSEVRGACTLPRVALVKLSDIQSDDAVRSERGCSWWGTQRLSPDSDSAVCLQRNVIFSLKLYCFGSVRRIHLPADRQSWSVEPLRKYPEIRLHVAPCLLENRFSIVLNICPN